MLNAVEFNFYSDSFEITSPVGNSGQFWSVSSNLKVNNVLLLRECVCTLIPSI